MVLRIGNVERALLIDRDAEGPVEFGLDCRAGVSREPGPPYPDHGRDPALAIHSPRPIVTSGLMPM